MLYSLCYPTLSSQQNDFIHSFRMKHDLPFRDVVSHHFTMAFGISGIDKSEYIEHVKAVARTQQQISFSCRYAMIGADDSNDDFYVFLVPDEGFSEISRLHDRLYTGPLKQFHRLDIPYIPHIGIATIADVQRIKGLCDGLNSENTCIAGTLDAITVSEYCDGRVADLRSFALGS